MDYSKYTFEDFLSDEYFINTIKNPTPESISYWEGLVNSESLSIEAFNDAKFFIESLNVEKRLLTDHQLSLMYDELEIMIEKKERSVILKKRLLSFSRVACVIMIILGGYFLFSKKQAPIDNNLAEIAKSFEVDSISMNVSLKISAAKEIIIEEEEAHIKYSEDGNVKINEIDEVVDEEHIADSYNQLWVPKGKRSTLLLADGSKLWVNAGTRVIYPTNFSDKTREVYVDGEIYLEVAKDVERPFIVNTRDMGITVLGTIFDVKAYESDNISSIVLIEGSVSVETDKQSKILKPNEMLSYQEGNVSIQDVDTEYYILWKTGSYRFNSENLSHVLNIFSNYYGTTINYDQEVGSLVCSGKLDLKEDIEHVLNGLCKMLYLNWSHNGSSYTLSKNKQEK